MATRNSNNVRKLDAVRSTIENSPASTQTPGQQAEHLDNLKDDLTELRELDPQLFAAIAGSIEKNLALIKQQQSDPRIRVPMADTLTDPQWAKLQEMAHYLEALKGLLLDPEDEGCIVIDHHRVPAIKILFKDLDQRWTAFMGYDLGPGESPDYSEFRDKVEDAGKMKDLL